MVLFSLLCSVHHHPIGEIDSTTYRPSIPHAIRCHDPQTHLQEHGDLVAPSHGDVWEAMDLGSGVLVLMLQEHWDAHQEDCPLKWCALGQAVEVACVDVREEIKITALLS